jgi:hypothetical protein
MGFAFNCMGEGVASWLETTHDFGTFEEKVKNVTCQIRFVNTGDSALVITNVRPTCGCTASEYPHDPIAVGDTASITLTYSAIGRPGQFSKDVFVYTNGYTQENYSHHQGQRHRFAQDDKRTVPRRGWRHQVQRQRRSAGRAHQGQDAHGLLERL